MKIYHRLTDKSKFLLRVLVFLYLTFSFWEWNLNPGLWPMISRTGLIVIFLLIAEINKKN